MDPLSISTIASIITLSQVLTPIFQKALKSFQWNKKEKNGIVKREALLSKKRLPGEVFAAELLTEPVRIEPSGGRLTVVVDRRNVEKAVITSEGKRELCEGFVTPEIDRLIELDRSIHAFLRNHLSGNLRATQPLMLPPMPFRWASGGIIPVVKIRGTCHIPMFFRDIRPAGWNIPLGSSERLIDQAGNVLSDFDEELNSPSLFILREFLEETLVLDRNASHHTVKRFHFSMPYDLAGPQVKIAQHLQDEHRRLRQEYDHMDIKDDNDRVLRPVLPPLPMDLKIYSDTSAPKDLTNVLIAVNCLELGIEVVKVIKYDIPDDADPYFLDGEILAITPTELELVRMPMALFPVELLRELFEGQLTLQYHGGSQASLQVSRELTKSDVTLFPWDIERRNAIIDGNAEGIGTEVERYKEWKATYGDFSGDSVSPLFTPATVKLLNILFSANILSDELCNQAA